MLSFFSPRPFEDSLGIGDSFFQDSNYRLLIIIINHGLNQRALELKNTFGKLAPTIAIDSGSMLTPEERADFDWCLPNVYYTGCLRAASAVAQAGAYSHVWIWASDVQCDDPVLALHRCEMVFKNTDAAVYAPSAHTSFHRHMQPRPGMGLQRVTYTDGFCFAVRTNLLSRACADFSGCRYGFGVDLHLGMLARQHLRPVLIDHNYHVRHPAGAGYSVQKATEEWESWQRRQPLRTLLFHKLAKKRISKTPFGMKLLLAMPW